ncbi:MAG: tungstate ABC transporter substrate-binding protein WtpA [Bacteroidota bacterium]
MNRISLSTAVLLVLFTFLTACNNNKNDKAKNQAKSEKIISGDLIIFHAGSLSVPFKEISEGFKKEYPDVNIIMESAGSRACARKITDIKRSCDIMASADYKVIDNLLIPGYADWNIKFASNEMSIVYHEESRFANEINKDNWFDILLKEDVAFGRADPNSDPCGYRAVLTSKLAENYYNKPGLAEKLLNKDLNYIRPKETDLLALLESNTIDYIFLYRSVAGQHKLKYLILPDEINLKDPEFTDLYSTVTIDISGKKPGEITTKKGEPLVYGVTVLRDAPNKKLAKAFVTFLLTKEKGIAIMEKNGQPSTVPSPTDTYDKIPDNLRKFAEK